MAVIARCEFKKHRIDGPDGRDNGCNIHFTYGNGLHIDRIQDGGISSQFGCFTLRIFNNIELKKGQFDYLGAIA